MRCHQRVNLRRGPPCLTCRHPIFYCHALKRFTFLQNWDKKILALLKSFKAPIKLEDMIQQGLYVKCAQACRVYFNKVQIMGLLYLFCGLSYLHQHEKEQRQNQNLVKIRGIYKNKGYTYIYYWLISIISRPSIIFASRGDNLESKQTLIDDFFFKIHKPRLYQIYEICKFQSNYSTP